MTSLPTDSTPLAANEDPLAAARDNPLLCNSIENNIRTLTALRMREQQDKSAQDRVADAITAFSGSMAFVYIHFVVFAAWVVVNAWGPKTWRFDPFPFQFLTLAVSLEAIFLATFVLISQNRMGEQADRRAELDLHIGLLSEHEITRVIKMLDAIQDKLGIENDDDLELTELEQEVRPQDVLEEIDRLEKHQKVKMWKLGRLRDEQAQK